MPYNKYRKVILLLLLTLGIKSYGQYKLTGVYCNDDLLNDLSNCFTFSNNNEFKFESYSDLGLGKIGNGTYKIEQDLLTLNYNKTKVNYSSYHRVAFWSSNKDSISLKFKIYDLKGTGIKHATIILDLKKKIGLQVNSKGEGYTKIKKSNFKNKIIVSKIGYQNHVFELIPDKSYDIEIYLSDEDNPALIKDTIANYRIISKKNGFLKLKYNDQEIVWKKLE